MLTKAFEVVLFAGISSAFGSFGTAAAECSDGYWKRSRSKCDSCGKILTAAELIPIVSYVLQKGRCRGCGAEIPRICLYMEVYAAILGAAAGYFLGVSSAGVLAVAMTPMITVQTVSDIEDGELYDWASLALLAVAAIYRTFILGNRIGGLAGAAAVGLLLSFFIRRGGMGAGDLLLAVPFGTMLGIRNGYLMLTGASLFALIGSLVIFIKSKDAKTVSAFWERRIPFGPYICFAGYTAFILQETYR